MDLVAYFSASGVTRELAMALAEHLNAKQCSIIPTKEYTEKDLDYMNPNSRSSLEMKDKNAHPTFIKFNYDMSAFDTIYLGFPIWWYTAPRIINSFLRAYDFTGKKIVLFATSGSTKTFGNTIKDLQVSAPKAKFVEGAINPKDFSWIK